MELPDPGEGHVCVYVYRPWDGDDLESFASRIAWRYRLHLWKVQTQVTPNKAVLELQRGQHKMRIEVQLLSDKVVVQTTGH